LQAPSHVRGDFVVGAANIPYDDTIPQIGEGNEFFSVIFTPQRVGSRVRVRCLANVAHGNAGLGIIAAALFRAGTANALAVGNAMAPATNQPVQIAIEYEYITADVLPITFSARFGINSGGSTYLNGRAAGAAMGGAMVSFLKVEEFSQ
jgi:hypothetical protein